MSAVTPLAMEKGMKVTITEMAFGRMCPPIIRALEAPKARAASTYSRAFSLYVEVRMYHVICVHPNATMSAIKVQKSGTTTLATIMITNKNGTRFQISIKR